MTRQERNRALSLAVLALGLCSVVPGWGAVTPGGDTQVAATSIQDTMVGNTGDGTLGIDGGSSLMNVRGYVGYKAGSTGMATVVGADSKWINSSDLYAGYSGSATLNVEGGALVSNTDGYLAFESGSSGMALVSGAASNWSNSGSLYVGRSGGGTLSIEASGQVSSANSYIGVNAGSVGRAVVTGAGSQWSNTGGLYVGFRGEGQLSVDNGGVVTAQTLYASPVDLTGDGTINVSGAVLDADLTFDNAHGSTQTLTFGAGGKLNLMVNGGALGAGYWRDASLRIADAKTVASSEGYLGYLAASTGTATVSGAGSKWNNTGNLYVGNYGSASLTIESGAEISDTTSYVGRYEGSSGSATVTGAGSRWTSSNSLSIGRQGNGVLRIEDGGQVTSNIGHLAYGAESSGTATVTGSGSTWSTTVGLDVGFAGAGSLLIANGGRVSSSAVRLGYMPGSSGTAIVDGAGSNWVNSGNLSLGGRFGTGSVGSSGTLTIQAGGQVSTLRGYVGDLRYSTGAATVSGVGSKWTNNEGFFVGRQGNGTLKIEAGGVIISSQYGHVGYDATGNGAVIVTGAGSLWSNGTYLYVARAGTGRLNIEAAGRVRSSYGYVGYDLGSTGAVTVCGADSLWINEDVLEIGHSGSGSLTVADGGQVTAKTLSVNFYSAVHLNVSGNAMLVLGNAWNDGRLTNNGTVNLYAGPSLPAGTYSPISPYPGRTLIMSVVDTGSYKAFGGSWDKTTKTFTVLAPTSLAANAGDTVTTGERLLFTDDLTGRRMGASFGSIAGSVSFSAAPMGAAELAGLAGVLEEGQGVLSAWGFTTNFSGGEAMLSFDIGTGAEDLAVWRYSGGVWSEFAPSLFTYDANGIASFTVSSFSGYAVTAAVPEPGVMGLLALGGAMLLIRRWPRG